MENEKQDLDLMPSRIKYYLLDWKDANLTEYMNKYGELRLRDLNYGQLKALFSYATSKDFSDLKTQP